MEVEVLPKEPPQPAGSEPEILVEPKQSADQPIELDEGLEVLPPDTPPELLESSEEALESELPEKKTKAVVPFDALSAYMREISHFPPLSKEEERKVALRYYHNKDRQAAYELISRNLMLVVKIARDYERAARSLLDLIQEGNIGLMEAVKNFDPYKGVRFPSYAIWWIKAYIIRYIIANWRMVKIGTTQAQRKLFFNLKKEKDKLEREGFYPSSRLLAEKLNVRESDIVEMEQRLDASDLSVDTPLQDDSNSSLLSLLPTSAPSAEDLVAQKQIKRLIFESLDEFRSGLNAKEEAIFEERMLGEEKATLQDLSEKLGLSRERIRQIENRIRTKLKDFLKKKFGATLEGIDFELGDNS